jgi:conjugal transfer ATP-binding protein TraC
LDKAINMNQTAQKPKATTQKFIEISDIVDNVVLFTSGNACSVIEVQATNFTLLSEEEQNAKILAYASLINSLSFPIQIFIRSKKIDISSYLKLLEDEVNKSQSEILKDQINQYKAFIQELVKINEVLDKKFYISLSYSPLEGGMGLNRDNLYKSAKAKLATKIESMQAMLHRINLPARTLGKEELTKLFSEIYNGNPEDVNEATSKTASSTMTIQKRGTSLADKIAPPSVEIDFNFIRVGGRYYKTFFIVGYPRYVSANWMSPVIDFSHSLNISIFIYPTSSADVLSDLRRKTAELEATIASQLDQGLVVDAKVQAALEDALGLTEELAKGVERFYQMSLYITLYSESLPELEQASKRLESTFSSLLILPKLATLQMEEGFKSSIPYSTDNLFITRNMDTTAISSTFPFTSATLTQDKGIMYGLNQQNGSLIIFDRFSLENANEVVFGKSGSGKSFLIKLEAMRQFMFGTEIIIIDPEGEYESITKTFGGEYVSFTTDSPIKINPFDLSGMYVEGENELGLKILSLHGLLKIVLGELDATHDAILDRALVETYRQKGITTDPATQKNQPPLMEDLYKVLLGMEDQTAGELALRLEKFIKGSLSGLFNQQSNFDIKNPFTSFSVKALEDELRPIAMHIILDFVWTKVRKSLKKRLLILDEAWYLTKYEDSASFVYGIAKRARKYYLALTTATQDVQDFLSTDYGKAILSNSSIQILLKQSPTEIDTVSRVFYLSQGEKDLLTSVGVGEGLFFAGQNHVVVKITAAPYEQKLATSNPREVLEMWKKNAQSRTVVDQQTELTGRPDQIITPAQQQVPITQPEALQTEQRSPAYIDYTQSSTVEPVPPQQPPFPATQTQSVTNPEINSSANSISPTNPNIQNSFSLPELSEPEIF